MPAEEERHGEPCRSSTDDQYWDVSLRHDMPPTAGCRTPEPWCQAAQVPPAGGEPAGSGMPRSISADEAIPHEQVVQLHRGERRDGVFGCFDDGLARDIEGGV